MVDSKFKSKDAIRRIPAYFTPNRAAVQAG